MTVILNVVKNLRCMQACSGVTKRSPGQTTPASHEVRGDETQIGRPRLDRRTNAGGNTRPAAPVMWYNG
jgi:hypothetical protein